MSQVLPVKLLLEHRRFVFGFIYTLTRDVDAAEEIFQEVSVTVLQETSHNAAIERFMPWVLGVARNRVSDYYRKRGREQPVPEGLADTMAEIFEDCEESRDQSARRIRGLLECVDQLPPRQRQILEFRYRDRKPLSRVAAGVGWKPEAVKVALSKIRRALLNCLRGKHLIEEAEAS